MFRKYKRLFFYKIKKKINIDEDSNTSQSSLDYLFNYYGTDKANYWDKNKGHGFSDFYAKELDDKKDKKINILEIGSYSGASAAAFSKYFPLSKIFCLDVNITNFIYKSKKINVFGLDVVNQSDILTFYKKINISDDIKFFDIIIDDGSHKLNDIIFSLNFFFKNLRDKGSYIIEDFRFPNYFKHLDNENEIKVDQLLKNLEKKTFFNSSIISKNDQKNLMNNIKSIKTYTGNSKNSDIAFIKKI